MFDAACERIREVAREVRGRLVLWKLAWQDLTGTFSRVASCHVRLRTSCERTQSSSDAVALLSKPHAPHPPSHPALISSHPQNDLPLPDALRPDAVPHTKMYHVNLSGELRAFGLVWRGGWASEHVVCFALPRAALWCASVCFALPRAAVLERAAAAS